MKRGQLLGQPLIYIFALIVAALVLFVGLSWVFSLKDTAEAVQAAKEVERIRDEVEKFFFLEEGSSKEIRLNFPSTIKIICFKDVYEEGLSNNDLNNIDPNLAFLMRENSNSNMFLVPIDAYDKTVYNIKNLGNPENEPFCFNNGAKIRLISRGDHVTVKLPA